MHPALFTTIFCLVIAYFAGLAIAVGYHRLLAHRSYKTHKWVEYALTIIGLPTGTPINWVASHRAHHAFVDREGDPRSINVHGFWYAQTGKYFRTNNVWICVAFALAGAFRILILGYTSPRADKDLRKFARDLEQDPFHRWISSPLPYFVVSVIFFVALTVPLFFVAGWSGLVAFQLTLIVIFNIGDASDTVSHRFGKRHPGQWHKATDLAWYAWLTMGDGWHSAHHSEAGSAKHGTLPGQYDAAWRFICGMERVGLAWDVKHAPDSDKLSAAG